MKKRKMMVRNLFLTGTIFAVLSAISGCKHSTNAGDSGTKTAEITVTVKKSTHVKKAPDSFKLAKGSVLGFTELKGKMQKDLEFDTDYELAKIRLDNAAGKEITNSSKHKFDKNTTIFIESKKIGSGSNEVALTELKVDGTAKTISDKIDCGKTKKDKVFIEAKASPADAEVSYEPTLESGFWKLDVGKKMLKIKVRKGSISKVYELKIERLDADTPVLKKLTVGAESKEGADITSEMKFSVIDSETEVAVTAETDPAGAKITYNPALTNGKLKLKTKETVLKITVGEDPKKTEYTVKVKKLVSPKTLAELILVSAGNKQGVKSELSEDKRNRILNGEKNVVIELLGPKASVILASRTKKWTSFKINGKTEKFGAFPSSGLTAVGFADIMLPAKGETMDVKIEIEDNKGNSSEISFKIKRLNETADIPANALIIGDKEVTGDQQGASLESLVDGSKPAFNGGEPSRVEIQCSENAMQSVTIDGKNCEIKSKKNKYDEDIWYAEYNVTGVSPNGKEITIVMVSNSPEDYHNLTWTFKLNYKEPAPLPVEYEINGKRKSELPKNFIEEVEKNNNPLIDIMGKSLNLKLTCGVEIENAKINENMINGDNFKQEGRGYILLYSIPLDTAEKQIEITFNPKDKSLYLPKILKFKAKGSGNPEVAQPVLTEISGDKNLPKAAFLDKLADGSKPLYKTFGSSADLVIYTYEYDYEFLYKEVKINEKAVSVQKIPGYFGNTYKIEKSIPIPDGNTVEVKIEFIGKENISSTLTWTFQVQSGGEKPKIPQSSIRIFRINGIGDFDDPLPEALTNHLIDGTNPVYKFEGTKALVEVGTYDNTTIEKVVFKEAGGNESEVVPKSEGFSVVAKHEFEFTDNEEHAVEAVIYPKDKKYGELTYSFKLQRSGKNPPLPLSFVGIDKKSQKSGYTATLNAEFAILQVQSREDVMDEVKIGEKDKDEVKCTINQYNDSKGKSFWDAQREIALPTDGSEKTFVIRIKPKDKTKYRETLYEYKLTGTKIAGNNAEFIAGKYGPKVLQKKLKWKPGLENNKYAYEYGCTAVTLTAYTVSPRATVKYRLVDIEDKPIAGQNENIMTNAKGIHTSTEITLFPNKPTIVKAWVIAEDGSTDNEKGVWKTTYNPVPLTWGYEDKSNGADYKAGAYDLIEIEKTKVTGNKIYLVFAPWNSTLGFTVDNTNLPAHQTEFEKLGALGQFQDYYKTSIDVSSLLGSSPSATELEAVLKIKKNVTDCFTYKVKIKVKQP